MKTFFSCCSFSLFVCDVYRCRGALVFIAVCLSLCRISQKLHNRVVHVRRVVCFFAIFLSGNNLEIYEQGKFGAALDFMN